MNDELRLLLQELERFGNEHDARTSTHRDKMLNITPETGELLAILVQAMQALHILEIGTSNGYSTLWLADAARAVAGVVVTVEISPAKAEMARRNVERAGLAPWVFQEVMDAGDLIREQPRSHFDLVFLDASRDRYIAWWPRIQEILAPGRLLVVDNALSHASELAAFIAEVQAAPGWRSVVVPTGNGQLLAVKPMEQ